MLRSIDAADLRNEERCDIASLLFSIKHGSKFDLRRIRIAPRFRKSRDTRRLIRIFNNDRVFESSVAR